MKTNHLKLVVIAMGVGVLLFASLFATPQAQQPAIANAAASGGASIKLNAEASKAFVELGNRQKEIIRQANEALQSLQREKQALLIGAGIPPNELDRDCAPDASGIVVCGPNKESAKSTSKAPPAKP